ncbi:MAG: PQQ-dependent dehydrogenase, methanol/ethanol family [Gammaproteobacteria bacterium]|nr:PQQ-dependent dehydrogenase, methanol/ethanol family [Gammaproteobacteria bacterium]
MAVIRLFICLAAILVTACSREESAGPSSPTDNTLQTQAADSGLADWPLHGNDAGEQRFSSLDQINTSNVSELGLAWYADIQSIDGLVATPIIVNGIIYMTSTFANVVAVDGKTGEILWEFDPEVRLDLSIASSWAARINRGVAYLDGTLYVGTGDCRLVAVDANTGVKRWDVMTCDAAAGYGITGAPRIAGDKVIIGNMGADFGVRGYVSAYDAEHGDLIWRFWLVPGDPALGYEDDAMAMAAKTWTGDNYWQYGGGSAWDSISYDAELNLVYVGTDSAPVLPTQRSPEGGDNLFLCSIVALDADTGEYRWHYQTTPADAWHYDAAMQMVLADLQIARKERKVLMQAPKNGFFYILDRETGELIAADNYVTVNWAEGVDLKTGKPVENPAARFYLTSERSFTMMPSGSLGGHNWHAMSFNPQKGLMYIPVHEISANYRMGESLLYGGFTVDLYGIDPDDVSRLSRTGKLIAWEPATGTVRWEYRHPLPMNGGVLSSAGGLVFQGTAMGKFHIYHAETGKLLRQEPTQASVQAPPVSYAIGGEQYILLPAGAGGAGRLIAPRYAEAVRGPSRLLAYKLGGKAELPPVSDWRPAIPEPPEQSADDETVKRGKALFNEVGCALCHGVDAVVGYGNSAPDLRYAAAETHEKWEEIVLSGSRKKMGMLSFEDSLSSDDARAIQAFVIQQAKKAHTRLLER